MARIDQSLAIGPTRGNGGLERCAGLTSHPTIAIMRNALSEDERRVLDLLAVGLPMHDVGQLLRISETVLQARIASLLRHYGAEDRTSLVATAYRRGDAPGLARLARSVALVRARPPA